MPQFNEDGFEIVAGAPPTDRPRNEDGFEIVDYGENEDGFKIVALPKDTLEKARLAGAGALAQSVADIGTGLKRLEDIGPAHASFRRHEAAMLRAGAEQESYGRAMGEELGQREAWRQRLMGPGTALEESAGQTAAAAREMAAETPGNKAVAKGAELVSGMVPYLLSGPAAPLTGALASAGSTYNQALEEYRKRGFSEEEAKAEADKAASAAGLTSGALFFALPGVGKTAAEKLLAARLKEAHPLVQAAVNTLAAGAQGSLVMGADTLTRLAQAKQSYQPDLTWHEALGEAARSALAGGLATGLMHGVMEGARLVGPNGEPMAREDVAPPAKGAGVESEFGEVPNSDSEGAAGPEGDLPTTPGVPAPIEPGPAAPASAEEVPAGPLSGIERKYLEEDVSARRPVAADLVERAGWTGTMPEGYQREGEQWVYQEPEKRLTPEQQMARDAAQAMAELRAQKMEEAPPVPETEKAKEPEQLREPDPDWDVGPPGEAEAGVAMDEEPTPQSNEPGGVWMGDLSAEQPPDILDVVGDSFRRGVKISSKEDYGDYVARARGRAKELLSATRGEPADQVLKALHESGQYRRIQTEDQLLEAMVGAGEERLARRGRADRIEAWLNRAIESTKPGTEWTGQASLGIAKLPVWLAQEAAHGALVVARAAYRTGRDLAQAISAAIEHVKGLRLPGFKESELKEWLQRSLGERETGAKVAASPGVTDETKQAITQYLYQRRTNAGDDEVAAGIIQRAGLDGAEQLLRQAFPGLEGAVWSRLLGQVTRGLAEAERTARGAGKTAEAQGLAERAGRLWDEVLPRITEQAQALQALQDLVELSPDAQVARARRRLERNGDEELDRHRPELDLMGGALDEGRRNGIEAIKADPEVNGAARAAVDAEVSNSTETNKAIVMELAQPWASSDRILEMARAQVRAKADELLNRSPMPAGLKPSQHLRLIMDDLAKRAATIAADYFQGIAQHKDGLTGLLRERLGLDQAHAARLAKGLDAEFTKQVEAARKELPKRIARQRSERERGNGQVDLNAPDQVVDAAIRRQLAEWKMKLGQVLTREPGRLEQTGAHVAERIVEASGLKGPEADTLRTRLKNRWDALVTRAQVQALEAAQKRTGWTVSRAYKGAFEKLVELDRLGALTSERFRDVVKRTLKLKQLTAGDAAELRRLAQRAQEQPEGFMRQRAAAETLKFTEGLSENRRWWDVPMAIFYNNILSGITTPAKIAFENTNLLVGQTLAALMARPGELLRPFSLARSLGGAYRRGLAKGALQGADTLRTGTVSGIWAAPKPAPTLETRPFGRLEPLNFWKYFGRVIGTTHEMVFKPAWEMKQELLARDLARRAGLSGETLRRRVADLMGNTDEVLQAARGQALEEMRQVGNTSKLDLERRVREIVEQRREQTMPGSTETSRDFALRSSYLNEPYGFMGLLAKGVRDMLEQARKKYPALGTGVKSQIPFTTIVANILNEKLNWTPVGLVRAAVSRKTGELYGRKIMDPQERGELYAKAIVGTIALGAAAELFGQHIHGNGPGDPRKKQQLQASGWIPHSIEYNGKFYSYMNTPLAVELSVLGNALDWNRYGKGAEADGLQRAAFVAKGTANAIVSQGMLDSVRRLFEALGSESTSEGGDRLTKLVARTGTAFVVPNLVQQIDRMFDPTVYDQTGTKALLASQVPFVRRENRPVLNVLGEPVQSAPFHYWMSEQSKDPVWRFIADHQAWLAAPNKSEVLIYDPQAPAMNRLRAATDDEHYRYQQLVGPELRKYIEGQLPRLETQAPEITKEELLKVEEKAGKAAKAKIWQERQ